MISEGLNVGKDVVPAAAIQSDDMIAKSEQHLLDLVSQQDVLHQGGDLKISPYTVN